MANASEAGCSAPQAAATSVSKALCNRGILERILTLVAEQTGSFSYALVNKRWLEMSKTCQRKIHARLRGNRVSQRELIRELGGFSRCLTSLHVQFFRDVAANLTDFFLDALRPSRFANLREVRINLAAEQSLYPSVEGLDAFFLNCPALTSFELCGYGYNLRYHDSRRPLPLLPSSLRNHPSLQKLKYGIFGTTLGLPDSLGQMTSLRMLHLTALRIKSSISGLSKLMGLSLYRVFGIPDDLGLLTALRSLRLTCCPISELPSSVSALQHLEELYVREQTLCDAPALGSLTALRSLTLDSCCNAAALQVSLATMGALEELTVWSSAGFRLPDDFSTLSELKKLEIGDFQRDGFLSQKALGSSQSWNSSASTQSGLMPFPMTSVAS